MSKLMDVFVVISIVLLNLAMILMYEVQRSVDNIYIFLVLPSIVSGVLVSIYSRDIRRNLVMCLTILFFMFVGGSILLSLPALIGIVPSDIINAFFFISIKKTLNSILIIVIPFIVSTLVVSSIVGGILGD